MLPDVNCTFYHNIFNEATLRGSVSTSGRKEAKPYFRAKGSQALLRGERNPSSTSGRKEAKPYFRTVIVEETLSCTRGNGNTRPKRKPCRTSGRWLRRRSKFKSIERRTGNPDAKRDCCREDFGRTCRRLGVTSLSGHREHARRTSYTSENRVVEWIYFVLNMTGTRRVGTDPCMM
jgi:hypothetical protein